MRASAITPTIVVQAGFAEFNKPAGIQVQTDAFAQRVLIGPVGASRGLIDDRNLGRTLNVLVVEKASAQQRHAQQVEVFGRNDGTIDHRSLIVHRLDAFADQWQPAGIAVAQGKSGLVADGRFLHAGQRPAAAKNLAQQDRFLRGGLIGIRQWDRWAPAARSQRPSRGQD